MTEAAKSKKLPVLDARDPTRIYGYLPVEDVTAAQAVFTYAEAISIHKVILPIRELSDGARALANGKYPVSVLAKLRGFETPDCQPGANECWTKALFRPRRGEQFLGRIKIKAPGEFEKVIELQIPGWDQKRIFKLESVSQGGIPFYRERRWRRGRKPDVVHIGPDPLSQAPSGA